MNEDADLYSFATYVRVEELFLFSGVIAEEHDGGSPEALCRLAFEVSTITRRMLR